MEIEEYRDAEPDEAFELGWVAGFNAAYEAIQSWSFTVMDKKHVLAALNRAAERSGRE